jgi:hypothetical protein
MRVLVDDRLRAEAERYRLVFACPACASFCPDSGACSLGYPNEEHIDERLESRAEVVFCKAFELV